MKFWIFFWKFIKIFINAFMRAFTPALECEALASLLKAVASHRIPKRIKNGEQRG
jgi:hypothetical protein